MKEVFQSKEVLLIYSRLIWQSEKKLHCTSMIQSNQYSFLHRVQKLVLWFSSLPFDQAYRLEGV